MPTPTVYPSAKAFLGLAKETTQGTAVVPITNTVPIGGPLEVEDKYTWLEDRGLRGSMSDLGGMVQGVGIVEWSIPDSPAFLDTLPFFINNILGDIATTGASPPYTHAMSLLNSGTGQPGSLTLVDWQGPPATNFARQYPGACLSELVIKGNAESSLIMWSAKGLAWPSAVIGSAPTAAPSTDTPYAAWRSLLGLAGPASGGTQIRTMREWEYTISRELKAEYTTQGTQNPYTIFRGKLNVTSKLMFSVPADETNSVAYLVSNTQPRIQIVMDNGLATSSARVLQIDTQLGAYDSVKINRGEEAVGYDTTQRMVINSTNAGASGGLSPIKITVQNATVASTY